MFSYFCSTPGSFLLTSKRDTDRRQKERQINLLVAAPQVHVQPYKDSRLWSHTDLVLIILNFILFSKHLYGSSYRLTQF